MRIPYFESGAKKQLRASEEDLRKLSVLLKEASDFIDEIRNGNLHKDISSDLSDSELGMSLLSMKEYVNRITAEEVTRNWMNNGLAGFSDILRNKRSLSLIDLSDDILKNLVKYINANQGVIFVLEGDEKSEQLLEVISCFAYNKKKFLEKRIQIGEGLAGQCVLEKKYIYLKKIPDDYVNITSGLGGARPCSVLVSPLLIDDKIFGVIELASLYEFESRHIEFVNKLSENIASVIKNVKDNERTIALLNESQRQAKELKSREEELRQNMEEMQATQEEIKRRSDELGKTSAEMTGIINGINATMATIEFKPDGTILNANGNFLRTMKYTLENIRGKHHIIFAPEEVLKSRDYQTFWEKLASGESISGVFKRVTSTGDIVWLNAIYNPISDACGQVVKVVKFATDLTSQQEMLAESKCILDGINATMATIEFKPDGTIINANENFLKTMKYALGDIQGKHHKIFAPKDVYESPDYKIFWQRLASGESMTGVFKRISYSGETIFLQAIYNPILNANGNVVKVVKFASDVTDKYKSE
jgi:PAS domain S-box-containing protein